ncbi:MAG: LysR family transcriptional regulator, partial [Myxococcota bacterium]|nr:LysR family transcriptional regulator [Myxococcota bacterium]
MLDDLRNLVLVVEHGTFTEAARHAHLSQPGLTASIRRLEQRVGARLLARGRHGASLTA